MIQFSKRHNEIPQLNTSALPDLIFSVLFFFMIATHMRNMPHILKYDVPSGEQLQKARQHKAINFVVDEKGQVQYGDDIIPVESVAEILRVHGILAQASDDDDPDEQQQVILRADKKAPMHVINALKQQLRQAGCLRIVYSANEINN